MALLALPTEVLTLIIRKLDTESVCKLYETCKHFRDVIRTPAVVKRCQFSLNTLATVKSFNLSFFINVSGHLKVLNLSGVHDLNKSALMSVLEIMKSLTDLDVSYTAIIMPDYLEFVKLTSALKSLAINFSFGSFGEGWCCIGNKLLYDYQQAFAGLKYIHFVITRSLLHNGKLVLSILDQADLLDLKLSILSCHLDPYNFGRQHAFHSYDWDDKVMLKTLLFQVYYIDMDFEPYPQSGPYNFQLIDLDFEPYPPSRQHIFQLIDLNKYEIVLFKTCSETVFATELLQDFIRTTFKVDVNSLNMAEVSNRSNQMFILLWDREQTKFNEEFYSKLLLILQEYLVYSFEFTDQNQDHAKTPVPEMYKWYHVKQLAGNTIHDSYDEVTAKRARFAEIHGKINYDNAFKNKKDNFKLKITLVPVSRPLSLHNSDILSKLSHLVLHGNCQLSLAFYNNLFSCCVSLVTLEITRQRGIVATPLQYLSKSRSIKNILLHVRGTQMVPFYTYLSQCRSLENIILVNTTFKLLKEVVFLPDPTELFTRCDRLYYLSLDSFFLEKWKCDEQLSNYLEVRSRLGKDGLNIDIALIAWNFQKPYYIPYISVFDVFRPKPM